MTEGRLEIHQGGYHSVMVTASQMRHRCVTDATHAANRKWWCVYRSVTGSCHQGPQDNAHLLHPGPALHAAPDRSPRRQRDAGACAGRTRPTAVRSVRALSLSARLGSPGAAHEPTDTAGAAQTEGGRARGSGRQRAMPADVAHFMGAPNSRRLHCAASGFERSQPGRAESRSALPTR